METLENFYRAVVGEQVEQLRLMNGKVPNRVTFLGFDSTNDAFLFAHVLRGRWPADFDYVQRIVSNDSRAEGYVVDVGALKRSRDASLGGGAHGI